MIGFFINVILMPGAHAQFQFWITPLFPMLVIMTGLPPAFTYSLYSYLFPVRVVKGSDSVHHIILLCIVFWLVTVGPKRDLLTSLLQLVGK